MNYLTTEKYYDDELRREKDKGKLYARINEVEDKHDQNFYALKLTIQTFIEGQKPINENMKGIREDLKEVNNILIDYVKKTDSIETELKRVKENQQASVADRNKFLITIITAALGAGGFVPVLIQVLFK